jgi:hypothetical protein
MDTPSEDEHGGSTRMPSSGGDSSSTSSVGRHAAKDTEDTKESRERWADVESDGEEVVVFDGRHWKSASGAQKESSEWAVMSKRSKN